MIRGYAVRSGVPAGRDPAYRRARKWVVYSTFDSEGAKSNDVAAQLREYRVLGFEVLVVDTSVAASVARERCWHSLSTLWMTRPNVGYDFGSYRAGLEVLSEALVEGLTGVDFILTNDSCYGPYGGLESTLARLDATRGEGPCVCGITESLELGRHLQSYWLYVRSDVSDLVAEFFAKMPVAGDREEAILNGEVALSNFLQQRGCTLRALLPIEQMVAHFGSFRGRILSAAELIVRSWLKRPRYTEAGDAACLKRLLGKPFVCNPTLAFGTHLHFQALSPFLKRQLIRDNPQRDPFVPSVPDFRKLDNRSVDELLKGTEIYRRRYRR